MRVLRLNTLIVEIKYRRGNRQEAEIDQNKAGKEIHAANIVGSWEIEDGSKDIGDKLFQSLASLEKGAFTNNQVAASCQLWKS